MLRKVGKAITLSVNGNTHTLICNKSNGWNVLGQIVSAEADGENLFGGERKVLRSQQCYPCAGGPGSLVEEANPQSFPSRPNTITHPLSEGQLGLISRLV